MARGNNERQSSARSEVVAPSKSVSFDWQKRIVSVPQNIEKELDDQKKLSLKNIQNAQDYLKSKDEEQLVAKFGSKEKVDEIMNNLTIYTREDVLKNNYITNQSSFNKSLKEIGNAVVKRDDPDLIRAVENYYEAQKKGFIGTYDQTADGGNGYKKSSFDVEYNKEQKGWEIKRHLSALLYSGNPEGDDAEEKGWFVLKGSQKDNVALQKAKKIAVILDTFIED
jgi:hypothetical protein